MCLVCGDALAVMKKGNLERHYNSKHAKLAELEGNVRQVKIRALRRSLESQQAAFARPRCDRDNVIRTSYVVSELIAKTLKPHSEGEFDNFIWLARYGVIIEMALGREKVPHPWPRLMVNVRILDPRPVFRINPIISRNLEGT